MRLVYWSCTFKNISHLSGARYILCEKKHRIICRVSWISRIFCHNKMNFFMYKEQTKVILEIIFVLHTYFMPHNSINTNFDVFQTFDGILASNLLMSWVIWVFRSSKDFIRSESNVKGVKPGDLAGQLTGPYPDTTVSLVWKRNVSENTFQRRISGCLLFISSHSEHNVGAESSHQQIIAAKIIFCTETWSFSFFRKSWIFECVICKSLSAILLDSWWLH